jgi:hypothetical protein
MEKKKKGLKLYPVIGLFIVGGVFYSNGNKKNVAYADEKDDDAFINETNEDDTYKDQLVVDFFNNKFNELQEAIKNADKEAIINKGKSIISNLIEFMFLDGDIMGVTFDELTDNTKKIIYSGFLIVDDLLEVYAPEYRETLSDKYQAIIGYIAPKFTEIKEFIGEENIDKLKDVYESTKEVARDLIQKGNDKLLK